MRRATRGYFQTGMIDPSTAPATCIDTPPIATDSAGPGDHPNALAHGRTRCAHTAEAPLAGPSVSLACRHTRVQACMALVAASSRGPCRRAWPSSRSTTRDQTRPPLIHGALIAVSLCCAPADRWRATGPRHATAIPGTR